MTFNMKAVFVVTVLAALTTAQARDRWSAGEAMDWQARTPWLRGSNFVPSSAINQLEMWQADTFDAKTIDRELAWAEALGFNSMRVFLHHFPYEADPQGFLKRLDEYLAIADRHHIGTMFVFFDCCWDPNPKPGKQREPAQGLHNSGWVQCPGNQDLADPSRQALLKAYVQDVVGRFKDDPRVQVWDIWNEPDNDNAMSYGKRKQELPNKLDLTLRLLPLAFEWARAAGPSQPLTAGLWQRDFPRRDPRPIEQLQLDQSDILSFHGYDDVESMKRWVAKLRTLGGAGRPILCTEYMARPNGCRFDPILGFFKSENVAAYNWGFVAGKSNTIYPWNSWEKPYAAEPKVWFHDIFRPDGSPFDANEVRYIREMTADQKKR